MAAFLFRLEALLQRALHLAQTDPAMATSLVQAALALVATLGFTLTAGQTGAIEAAVSAALGAAVAWYTRPVRTAAAVAFVTAAGTLLVAFRVPHVTAGTVSAFSVLVTAVLNLAVTSPQTASLKVMRERIAARAGPRM